MKTSFTIPSHSPPAVLSKVLCALTCVLQGESAYTVAAWFSAARSAGAKVSASAKQAS
ncbi:unannotated protein [freshwater metagenome]|uniref:Unannotated protein n=1 Tax=freshwater metagenome TaxID=449393 RepID=A0A6J7EH17_9ZZZZ